MYRTCFLLAWIWFFHSSSSSVTPDFVNGTECRMLICSRVSYSGVSWGVECDNMLQSAKHSEPNIWGHWPIRGWFEGILTNERPGYVICQLTNIRVLRNAVTTGLRIMLNPKYSGNCYSQLIWLQSIYGVLCWPHFQVVFLPIRAKLESV